MPRTWIWWAPPPRFSGVIRPCWPLRCAGQTKCFQSHCSSGPGQPCHLKWLLPRLRDFHPHWRCYNHTGLRWRSWHSPSSVHSFSFCLLSPYMSEVLFARGVSFNFAPSLTSKNPPSICICKKALCLSVLIITYYLCFVKLCNLFFECLIFWLFAK